LAQDDYYYEIQLTNKQLVFYFLAGATVLIISFLAGIMVGRGVDARTSETRLAREEPSLPAADEGASRTPPVTIESYSYAQRLAAERVPESLETPRSGTPATVVTASPTPGRTAATPRASPVAPAVAPTPRPAATPRVVSVPPVRPTPARPTPATGHAPRPSSSESLVLQVGAFRERSRAETVVAQLRKKGYPAHVGSAAGERAGLFNVYVGPYKSRVEAERVKSRLAQQERFNPFIVQQ
jgi:cell division septation protein DedD